MTVATLAFIVALFGWIPHCAIAAWRLRRAEQQRDDLRRQIVALGGEVVHVAVEQGRLVGIIAAMRAELADLRANERTNALDICRIGDEHVETRGYVMGHTRALDAHDERLQALETSTETV